MANDVEVSAIYLGSFADIDTHETNNDPEFASSLLGTYGGPGTPLSDSVTTLDTDSPGGTVVVDHAGGDGTITYDVGSGLTTQTLDNMLAYDGTITFADGSSQPFTNFILIQAQNGDVFVVAQDNQTDLSSQAIESITLSSPQSGTYFGLYQTAFDDMEFVCYGDGTGIMTAQGTCVPVERLSVGDLILTADHGPQPIRWIGKRTLTFGPSPHRQKPIEIKAGALGNGQPNRTLIVSPQHRILMSGPLVQAIFSVPEVLAPAIALTGLRGVRVMQRKRQVTYHSLLCDRHEIIMADGAWSETLYPGPMALRMIGPDMRHQLETLLPALRSNPDGGFGPTARPTLRRREAEMLVDALLQRQGQSRRVGVHPPAVPDCYGYHHTMRTQFLCSGG
ncbi:MAG: Hint domain-containing protein [Pseudomonadota bacterium]